MKSIKQLYSYQVTKVCSLINKLKRTKNPLTRERLTIQLSEAQARARELDGLRTENYQLAAQAILEVNETDLIQAPGHKFNNIKKAS